MSTAQREAARRVNDGATFLDRTMPGWWRCIDVGKLDLSDSCRCVLGQLHAPDTIDGIYREPYFVGCILLDIGNQTAQDMGFNIGDDTEDEPTYGDLDEAWISAVKQRFESGAA